MIKVVNPLFRKEDNEDSAYNCACYCNVAEDNYDNGSAWTWLPWNSCGCSCQSGDTTNQSANNSVAESN